MKKFVAIAGNMGVGKSALTTLLSQTLGWEPFFEAVDDNPYLADFYRDMQKWSFHSQIFFLSRRLRHHREGLQHPHTVVQDRSVYEDAEIFARNLYDIGKMDQRDYSNYVSLFEVMTDYLKSPNLMIYLRASTDTLMQQISRRGRSFEQGIQREYLEQLNKHYENWISRYKRGPLLIIESDNLDFVNRQGDLEQIVRLVRQKLDSIVA